MIAFAITGGIGMGKSTVAALLQERGIPVVDSDIIARQVVEPGQPALAEIATCFGADMLGSDGRLRRDLLAARVFGDETQRKRLEAILHPRIRAVWQTTLNQWRDEGRPTAVGVVPLLYEVDAAREFDRVICVACSAATQRERLLTRGWSLEQIRQRSNAQWPVEKKLALADVVVWTEGALSVVRGQLNRIFH